MLFIHISYIQQYCVVLTVVQVIINTDVNSTMRKAKPLTKCTAALIPVSLLKCPIPNSKFGRPRGEVFHLRLPRIRHTATLVTIPIPGSYYYYYYYIRDIILNRILLIIIILLSYMH